MAEEKRGTEAVVEKTITCADCGKELINVLKIRESDKNVKIKCKCDDPECDGESWVNKFYSGDYVYGLLGLSKKQLRNQSVYLHMDYDPDADITTAEIRGR
tara:strand:+ start:15548 stop:15850 length:303 start_codon:yes stop_codon:yes gene_type:complete